MSEIKAELAEQVEAARTRAANSPGWQPGTRLAVGVLMIILLSLLLYRLRQLLAPVILAFLLAYILYPVVRRLEKRLGSRRGLAVGLVYVVILLLLGGTTTGIGIAFSRGLASLGEFLERVSRRLPEFVDGLVDLQFAVGPWVVNLTSIEYLAESLTSAITPLLSQTGSLLTGLAGATATLVGNALILLVIGFYVLLYFERIQDWLISLVPAPYQSDARTLMSDTGKIWQAFLRGQLLLALVVGVATAVVMAILGVRFALGIGLIAGVLEFIPIFGPLVTGIISVLVALFQGSNHWGLTPFVFALVVAGASLVIQQIENNILVPRIIGHSLDLNPLVVILALLAAGSLAGVVGLLLAAPAVATLKLIFGYLYWKTVGVQPPVSRAAALPAPARPSAMRRLRDRFNPRRDPQKEADPETTPTS
ncbi:MAG: AI-2E family transporter [Chloroflexota bacterium]